MCRQPPKHLGISRTTVNNVCLAVRMYVGVLPGKGTVALSAFLQVHLVAASPAAQCVYVYYIPPPR